MRKLILQEYMTIDGYLSDLKGDMDAMFGTDSGDGQESMDYLRPEDDIDTILCGAKTFKGMATYWPTSTQPIAKKVNTMKIIVFTKSLQHAPWGKSKATIIKDNAANAIQKLKQEPGKNMIMYGSIRLAQPLINEDVFDEYQLRICPVLLGIGKRLFDGNVNLKNMKLLETKVYKSGLVLLRYKPEPKST